MTPAGSPRLEARRELHEVAETAAVVDAALARFRPPPGWRVLRGPGRLEARWRSGEDRWARFSVRFVPAGGGEGAEPMFSRRLGEGSLVVTFDCSDLGEETVRAASELLTPMQRLLAQAAAR
jgi:hypothetical protein